MPKLYRSLGLKSKETKETTRQKIDLYIYGIGILSLIFAILLGKELHAHSECVLLSIVEAILIFIPLTEIVVKIVQNVLGKIVKPKLIPKMDLSKGITEENTTMVVIPTIVDTRREGKESSRETRGILSC